VLVVLGGGGGVLVVFGGGGGVLVVVGGGGGGDEVVVVPALPAGTILFGQVLAPELKVPFAPKNTHWPALEYWQVTSWSAPFFELVRLPPSSS
jgi:hypothetical protein